MTEGEIVSFHLQINKLNLIEGEYSLGLYLNTTLRSGDIYDLGRFTVVEQDCDSRIPLYDTGNKPGQT